MASNESTRLVLPPTGVRLFYEALRSPSGIDEPAVLDVDEANLMQHLGELDSGGLENVESRMSTDSVAHYEATMDFGQTSRDNKNRGTTSGWPHSGDDGDDGEVPASLLVESMGMPQGNQKTQTCSRLTPDASTGRNRARWHPGAGPKTRESLESRDRSSAMHPIDADRNGASSGRREKALWRWVNITNLDSFMRDVYDYYEGGGMWCIMCSNALWLLETLFVAVLLTILSQCIEYSKIPHSKSLNEVVIAGCSRKMSGIWSFGLWLYSFFFIWKSVQYFFEIRRLLYIQEFFVVLLEIPEQDMQSVSWQDVVARIMALRDQNPKTATNIQPNLRRFMGSQSKERLDAHDIANRLMRKENYLIAMINKDLLNLSLPVPFLKNRQLFSKTMEWYLQYCILDMAFNELGQVQQDFLRPDRRGILSRKLKQRFYFAGTLNLIFAPIVLAYMIIVYFFTYYNEYQKDPKLAAARKYTALAEWKFREFNELPHIFYERLHMSFPFATRYIEQFPKRMTEEIARSVAFMSGALTAILALGTILDSELFLGFEITKDRTVLFYLGVFGAIWALTRGMVSEEAAVFNPEYALRNVVDYIHYMPAHWHGRLHSFEVKQEFAELYKMKVIIFLEEVMGIITTPLLLLLSLPACSDQVVDFFREFTIHVDGLGYVCSFAVFDFKKGFDYNQRPAVDLDVREDYYATKHGKMAASYYGFLDNYVINPRTGIPGHMPPATQQQFYPPPTFPSLHSPTLATDLQTSPTEAPDANRMRSRVIGLGGLPRRGNTLPLTSPMTSLLLDPHHQPVARRLGTRSMQMLRHRRGTHLADNSILEEGIEDRTGYTNLDDGESEIAGILGESTWETSPGKGLSREDSAANIEESEAGVLGLIHQLHQTQHHRRGMAI